MESRTTRLGNVPWKPVIFALSLGLIALGFIAATTILPGPPIIRAILVSATNVDTFTSKGFQVGTGSVNVGISVDSGGAIRVDGEGIRNNGWQKVSGPGTNTGVFYADGGLVAGQTATSGPSYVRLQDTTTGNFWQWSTVGAASNVVERTPTNGNMGLHWGIKVWTNAAYAADGTPTNQAMNFQLGAGLLVDWANRQITASGSGGSGTNAQSMLITNVLSSIPHWASYSGTNVPIDLSIGNVWNVLLTNNAGIYLTNVPANWDILYIRLRCIQAAPGNFTVTTNSGETRLVFGQTACTGFGLTTNVGAVDIFGLSWDSSSNVCRVLSCPGGFPR